MPSVARAPLALYLHVPFCVGLCPYCDFVVYTGRAARGPARRVEAFLRAVHVELDLRADALDASFGLPGSAARPSLRSVYLGGGTPSLLSAGQVAALVSHVERRYGIADGAEITLEANPGPDERGDLAGFRAAGITRLSLGAQALDDRLLRSIGRRHRRSDVAAAVGEARAAGFADVSLDLLYDLPGQTVVTWASSLAQAIELGPDHLSTYALDLADPDAEGLTGPAGDHLPVRPGARAWRSRTTPAQDPDRAADMDELADEALSAAGFRRYEIANHARPGHESRHNLAYWRKEPYEAVGPGAHAFDGGAIRRWNAARLDGYLGALLPEDGARQPKLPPGGAERMDAATAQAETLILGLRLDEGVPLSDANRVSASAIAWAIGNDLAAVRGSRVALTARGRLLSNELFARLLPRAEARAVPVSR